LIGVGQAGLGTDLTMRIVAENSSDVLAAINRPSKKYEGQWRIQAKPETLADLSIL
jgi:hypothetical protein